MYDSHHHSTLHVDRGNQLVTCFRVPRHQSSREFSRSTFAFLEQRLSHRVKAISILMCPTLAHGLQVRAAV